MRQPNPKSKTNRLVLTGRDEERDRINAFKELCARNHLNVRDVLMEKVDSFLRQHNWPPGNSQMVITVFTGEAKTIVKCQHPNCDNPSSSEVWAHNKWHGYYCETHFFRSRDAKLLKRWRRL